MAGSIDPDKKNAWRDKVITSLKNRFYLLDPRYSLPWSSIEAESKHIHWELDAMERADIILMNFLGSNKSPISLIEFGLYAKSGKLVVVCSDQFWKRDYIKVVAARYNIPMFLNIEAVLPYIDQLF